MADDAAEGMVEQEGAELLGLLSGGDAVRDSGGGCNGVFERIKETAHCVDGGRVAEAVFDVVGSDRAALRGVEQETENGDGGLGIGRGQRGGDVRGEESVLCGRFLEVGVVKGDPEGVGGIWWRRVDGDDVEIQMPVEWGL